MIAVIDLITCVVFTVGTLVAVYAAYIHVQHMKYSHLPGAKRASFFLGHKPQIKEFTEKKKLPFAELIYQWHKKYGLVFCIQVLHHTIVVVLDSKVVKDILTNSKNLKPSIEYDNFTNLFGARFVGHSLVNETNHAKWSRKRALFNPAFHRKYLMSLLDVFNDSADRLMENLLQKADGQTEVSMSKKFNNITLDVIGKVGFGVDLNAIEDVNSPFCVASTMVLTGLQKKIMDPFYSFVLTKEARTFRRKVREACGVLRKIGGDCIRARLEAKARGEESPKDILSYLLEARENLKCHEEFGEEEMVDEFVTFFVAGQETTGNHLAFTLQQLCRYPDVMKKVLLELDEVLGDRPFVSYQDLSKLEYLMLVMKESMRQYPPASGTSRVCDSEVECCGYTIPKGTRLRFNHYTMCRMERYFDSPEEFRPERFQASENKLRHLYAYFPFSLGQRNCIGQSMATMETKVVLAKLLRRFKFELVPGQCYVMKHELTNKPIDGCKVYVTVRD